ncbi:hypothetical protein NO995_04250 [Aestuariibaculum sp. M13]|uniref:hypothetical protein n=1 Tax=Aestuariibaculum sp. M13 TaxID=2967132 RepID=UPI002159F1BB|nr:hypothetical protein [Aestuariibaculum sp. M13]MCR8666880.1 hypothetical protein [Aestuariibaculum sp. M13]
MFKVKGLHVFRFFVFLFGFSNLYSQTYISDFEESIFKEFKADSINYNFLESLFAIDSVMNKEKVIAYREELLAVIKNLPQKEDKDKKEIKRVKVIYDVIHDKFLKKYNLDSYFHNIFKDGTYNCVTATALYVFVFDNLNIPYHVKETPSHVFLIAYPDSYKIYLETTAPGAYGYSVPKETEVKTIVDELIAYKLVTQEEVSEKGYMSFYEEYYYGKEFLEKSVLIGMQYYNKGLTHLNELKYDEASNNLIKAKVFYSSPLIKPILKTIMYTKVNDLEFKTQEDVDYLIELIKISKYPEDYSLHQLKSSLFKITQYDENDVNFIEEVIVKFNAVSNDKVRNEAVEYLYEYLARQAATDEELDNALRYCDNILNINKNSKISKEIIEYACFKKVMLSMYDLRSLENFLVMTDKYEFLKSNKRYFISLAHFYGNMSLMNYKNKEISLAAEYLSKFEEVMDGNDILNDVNKYLISELYLKAGNYYYFKNNYPKSYHIFSKGLDYVPGHPDLVKKADWSREEF